MMTCTFFGHADVPEKTELILRSTLEQLIQLQNVTRFYVGNQGNFDRMVRRVLSELSMQYQIRYYVVLPYFPKEKLSSDMDKTILPEELEKVPARFAIDHRNRWMLRQADIVVTYVTRPVGGAAKYKEIAQKQNKIIRELSAL